jgi:hypothetical protein
VTTLQRGIALSVGGAGATLLVWGWALGLAWWRVLLAFFVTALVLILGTRSIARVAADQAILASAEVTGLLHLLNLSLWTYIGFLLLPLELFLGAGILKRGTSMRWLPSLLVVAVARGIAVSVMIPGYFVDMFT